ncbi:NEDD8-conjugating enzyme Ubc12 [Rhipicephalus sanguineus]|uniref:E2 NEDD8-conjugating enzyme n=1 Tax=Rhipicephalus sanguineus TaxID=34632 RepID=A0A9D4QDI7_RHISA|nr:NEDD8-conjugating enzyme Ubc12 [Rhipicephalus sanguineus]KAH7975794.1 hypothetical protein HPB52_005350 [Rhipicephalus sanguineus]
MSDFPYDPNPHQQQQQKQEQQLQERQHEEAETSRVGTVRCSAALTRVTKDINDLDLPSTCQTVFPNPDDLMNFKLTICPEEGFYRNGRFVFNFRVGDSYPHKPPKVKCETRVFHPNIDLKGHVCLNILRSDWNPVMTLGSVVVALQFVLLEPNTDDPFNEEAGQVLLHNRKLFEEYVGISMSGGRVGSTYYDYCLK